MESHALSPPPDDTDAKAAFRKPSNDAANRKYRRRSPVSGSSSSDGSPSRDRSYSPIRSRKDPGRDSDRRRKDDGRDFYRDSGRNSQGRVGDSYRRSDRQSSRSSHNYHRRDNYVGLEKHVDEEERNYRSSSRYGRESRAGTQSDQSRRESEHHRSRDHLRRSDKYSRDKFDGSANRSRDKESETLSPESLKYKDNDCERVVSGRSHNNSNVEYIKSGDRGRQKGDEADQDEKRDFQKSSGDYRSDHTPHYEEQRGHRNDSTSVRDSGGRSRLKEASKSDSRELDGKKYSKEEKKKNDDRDTNWHKDRYDRESGELFEPKIGLTSENPESAAKKPNLLTLGSDYGKDGLKFTALADANKSTSSKQAYDLAGKAIPDQAPTKGSEAVNNIDAAKVAAMRAAELVNKNLIGTGYMSADQKKKLLWGSKKTVPAEEPVHRWDTALFTDRERQEKFNKLMGVKGDLKVEHKPDNQESSGLLHAEKQKELLLDLEKQQLDLEKQYTAGLRRRDGRTVGLGL